MARQRPTVLSVAGFDPCSGAGVTADIKTFEMLHTTGLGVATCITYQHESRFDGVDWLAPEQILRQLDVLLARYRIGVAKIGLIEHAEVLDAVIGRLHTRQPGVRIVWDPVMRAGAGFRFHSGFDNHTLERLCRSLLVVTPNLPEMAKLLPGRPVREGAAQMSAWCAVFLKGGHCADAPGYDELYTHGAMRRFRPRSTAVAPKHGSGCVLSAALAAALAHGFPLQRACLRAKQYTLRFLESAPGLLGVHRR